MGIMQILHKASTGDFGFRIREQMSGRHVFEQPFGEPGAQRPFEFRITWGPTRILDWLNPLHDRFLWQKLRGTVTIDGLCEQAPCEGTLELRYFSEGLLRYTFEFAVDGQRYRYVGEKVNIRPWNLPVSHTTCFGVLTEADTGRLVSRSVCHFRLSTAWSFLTSLRLC